MYYEHPNFVIDNIFTEKEILQIYDHINNIPKDLQQSVGALGYIAYHGQLPENIVLKIQTIMQNNVPYNVKLKEFSFAKYTFDSGYVPKLFPHFDDTFKEPRITLDIQINGNFDWKIYVEGKDFLLKNNQALVFSGTHQIHWRENKKIYNDQFLDMIFCHFVSEDYPLFENSHRDIIIKKDNLWKNKINIEVEPHKVVK